MKKYSDNSEIYERKRQGRLNLAALSFEEKIAIVEAMQKKRDLFRSMTVVEIPPKVSED